MHLCIQFDLARSIIRRNALAFHAFEQLRQVPDLLIGGDFAVLQVGGAILQVERAGPQVQTTGQFGDEGIQVGGSFSGKGSALDEADGAGVGVVDVCPIRCQSTSKCGSKLPPTA